MKVGDIVKFREGLYDDEEGATYRILELNGDRCFIVFICDLPIPPQSAARTNELELVHDQQYDASSEQN
jgi:hypothetical protein